MRSHLILLLVTICVTSAPIPDIKNSAKRGRSIRFRNASQVLPVGRSTRGQSMPILRFRSRVLSRPNARFIIPWSRNFSARNSRPKRPTPRPMTPAVNRGTSALRAINIGPPRNFRRNRFFAVPTRSRSLRKSFKSHYRMPTSRLSMTRKGWSRRITRPKKFFPRDTGKRIVTIPIQFHPTKENVSEIRPPFDDEVTSKRITESQHGSIPGMSGLHPPVRAKLNRRGDPRALSAPRSFFSYPRATNMGFRSRITSKRQGSSQISSRIPHDTYRPRSRMPPSTRTMSSNRIPTPYSRRFFKGARSSFRPFSARKPSIPGFRSFDRRISSRGWSGPFSILTASKSTPLKDNKSWYRFGGASIPRNTTTQVRATFMESSPAEISQSGQNSSEVDAVSYPKSFIADQSGGIAQIGEGNVSGTVFTVAGSVSDAADNATDTNQTLVSLVVSSLSNAVGTPSGNASQTSVSDIDFERPNADAPAPDDQNQDEDEEPTHSKNSPSAGDPDDKKLAWLTKIVNTRDGLAEAMDDGNLISRLRQSGPHTYADLMTALRKGSHFNDEVIVDLQSEGLWDPFLRAAGISPKDQVEHRSKLGWLTDIVNEREGLEEAMDDAGLSTKLQQTGPHTYDDLMDALQMSPHFTDAMHADMKSKGRWGQFLRTAGIKSIDIDREDRMPETENTATNIEVKTYEVETLNPVNVDNRAGHAGRHNLSSGQQMMIRGSATPVGRTANSAPAPASRNAARTNGSKTTIRVSSGTVSPSKVLLKVPFRSDLTNGDTRDTPENAAVTNEKSTRGDLTKEKTQDTPEKDAGENEKNTTSDLTNGETPDIPEKDAGEKKKNIRNDLTNQEAPDTPENVVGTNEKNTRSDPANEETPDTPENDAGTNEKNIRSEVINEATQDIPEIAADKNEGNTRIDLANEETLDTPENAAVTNEENTRRDPANEETPDTPENAAGTNEKNTVDDLSNEETPDTPENDEGTNGRDNEQNYS